eukprot:UN3547
MSMSDLSRTPLLADEGTVSRRLSLQDMKARQQSQPLWANFRAQETLMQDRAILKFFSSRFIEHLNNLQKVPPSSSPTFFYKLNAMAYEIANMEASGFSFDVAGAFSRAVEDGSNMGPYPSGQEVNEFLVAFYHNGYDHTKWKHIPVFAWYAEGSQRDPIKKSIFCDGGLAYPSILSWTMIAWWTNQVTRLGLLDERSFDMVINPMSRAQEVLATQVLPKFALELAELETLVDSQLQQISDLKTKLLGACVTAGVT